MINLDMTKKEIEDYLSGKGDFVKIDHLTRFLENKSVPIDKKKFVYGKLSEIYEGKKMFSEAAKMCNNMALCSIAFSEKSKYHTKEAQLYVMAGNFKAVDSAMKKATADVNATERENIHFVVKEFCKRQAEAFEKSLRRAQTVRIYESLLQMDISEVEKEEIKLKLMGLYEKLGRVKDYFKLKKV